MKTRVNYIFILCIIVFLCTGIARAEISGSYTYSCSNSTGWNISWEINTEVIKGKVIVNKTTFEMNGRELPIDLLYFTNFREPPATIIKHLVGVSTSMFTLFYNPDSYFYTEDSTKNNSGQEVWQLVYQTSQKTKHNTSVLCNIKPNRGMMLTQGEFESIRYHPSKNPKSDKMPHSIIPVFEYPRPKEDYYGHGFAGPLKPKKSLLQFNAGEVELQGGRVNEPADEEEDQ